MQEQSPARPGWTVFPGTGVPDARRKLRTSPARNARALGDGIGWTLRCEAQLPCRAVSALRARRWSNATPAKPSAAASAGRGSRMSTECETIDAGEGGLARASFEPSREVERCPPPDRCIERHAMAEMVRIESRLPPIARAIDASNMRRRASDRTRWNMRESSSRAYRTTLGRRTDAVARTPRRLSTTSRSVHWTRRPVWCCRMSC